MSKTKEKEELKPYEKFIQGMNILDYNLPLFDENHLIEYQSKIDTIKDVVVNLEGHMTNEKVHLLSDLLDSNEEELGKMVMKARIDYNPETGKHESISAASFCCNLWLTSNEFKMIKDIVKNEHTYTFNDILTGRFVRDNWLAIAESKVAMEGFPTKGCATFRDVVIETGDYQSFELSRKSMTNLYNILNSYLERTGGVKGSSPRFEYLANVLEKISAINQILNKIEGMVEAFDERISKIYEFRDQYVQLNLLPFGGDSVSSDSVSSDSVSSDSVSSDSVSSDSVSGVAVKPKKTKKKNDEGV